jgi:hypothetical protein
MEDGEEVIVVLLSDRLLETGETYLFFSVRKENGALNAPPFARFLVTDGDTLSPLPDWADLGASRALAGLTVAEALDEIRAIE